MVPVQVASAASLVFYVVSKKFDEVEQILERDCAISADKVHELVNFGMCSDEEMLVPIEREAVQEHFVDVAHLVEQLGAVSAAVKIVQARRAFVQNEGNISEEERAQPLSVLGWRAMPAVEATCAEEAVLERIQWRACLGLCV